MTEADPHLRHGPDQQGWIERVAVDYDNVRAAMRFALAEAPGLRVADRRSIAFFVWLRGGLRGGARLGRPSARRWIGGAGNSFGRKRSSAVPSYCTPRRLRRRATVCPGVPRGDQAASGTPPAGRRPSESRERRRSRSGTGNGRARVRRARTGRRRSSETPERRDRSQQPRRSRALRRRVDEDDRALAAGATNSACAG